MRTAIVCGGGVAGLSSAISLARTGWSVDVYERGPAIREIGAARLKDAGRVIAALKERYNGQMDFATAKRLVCSRLH